MESLYTKYRPQTFQDVVGQQVVVSTLENAVLEGRTGHAYLFCGPRGTGKTTMARLLAKALMCEQGPNHLPDGTCEQCRLIAAGEHPDVYELDAASRTGVDNVREEIINRVGYAPVRGRYKVYIIDEVHMLTTAAFNALLKTLEEPPEHVVFILCTTDPQKIPATIISRVQRFDFHAISNDEIRQRLVYVCQQEGFSFDEEALDLVVRHARGGMRDALSTLEQLSVFGNGAITLDSAQDMLGSVPGSTLDKVCDALAVRNVAMLYREVANLVDGGRDLLQFVRELAARVRDVYVVCAVGAKEGVVTAGADELELLKREAQEFGSVDRLSYVLTVLGDVSNEMRTATNQRLSLEIAFTRIARPKEDLTLESLASRVSELEAEVSELRKGRRAAVDVAVPSAEAPVLAAASPAPQQSQGPEVQALSQKSASPHRSQSEQVTAQHGRPEHAAGPRPRARQHESVATPAAAGRQPSATPQPAGASQATVARPEARPVSVRQGRAGAAPAAGPTPAQTPAAQHAASATGAGSVAITDPGELQRRWRQAVDTLIKTIPSRGSLLMSSSIVSDDGSTLVISLPKGSTFALKMLDRADVRQAIEPPIGEVFGGPRALSFGEASPREAAPTHEQRQTQQPGRSARPAQQAQRNAQPAHRPVPPAQETSSRQTPATPTAPSSDAKAARGSAYKPSSSRPASPRQAGATPSAPATEETSRYEMPWDPAVPASAEVPHEEVPYDDADAMPYGEDAPMYEDAASATPSQTAAPATRTFGTPATTVPETTKRTDENPPTASADVSSSGEDEPVAFDADSIPDDIPDDLRSIIEDCFEVFGDGVKVSSAPPRSTDGKA